MLRFNPGDAEVVFQMENAQPQDDVGLAAMMKSLTEGAFRHCWHRGMEALAPPAGSYSTNFLSQPDGEVLAWDSATEYGAYNFTTRTELVKATK